MEFDNTNIYPVNVEKYLFHRSDSIVSSLKYQANNICRNMINEEYIKHSFKKFDYGFIYKNRDNQNLAFCIWKERNKILKDGSRHKYIHILLICSNINDYKFAQVIFFDIDSYCLNKSIGTIELEAINLKVAKYYRDHGFILERDKAPYNMVKIIELPIKINRIKKSLTRKRRSPLQYNINNEYNNLNILFKIDK